MTNRDKAIPEVEVEWEGKKYTLKFSNAAFVAVEEATGKSCLDGETFTKPTVTIMTALFWAGLRTHHPEVTLAQVRDSTNVAGILALYDPIIKSMNNGTPESDPGEKKSE